MLSVATLRGLWQRSLIAWPDGRRDETTAVWWLQGPGLYIDLRQPAGRPDFAAVHCLDDLDREQARWLAGQEGFAGELTFDGRHFTWARDLDVQPVSPYSDAGSLRFENDVLVEEGRDVAYVEHWHRGPEAVQPCSAARLACAEDGRAGFVVRCGERFMYARARTAALPAGGDLAALVAAAPTAADARDLIDCEISIGRIGPAGWTIEHSSLPYREGAGLGPVTGGCGAQLLTRDIARNGREITRAWRIEALQGALTDLVDFSCLRRTAP
ncbi:hypothetical protein [Zavarzinia sp.]|uniref:hypothetical protein n=1 Tax=Zavarzinia sp. TaxID=2027920 RepID=UPI00356AFF85